MSAYYIRTRAGEKGPFSDEQLFRLVDEGRIPVTLQVIDAESGQWVVVEDLYPPPEPEPADVLDDEVFELEDEFEEPIPEPPRPARFSRPSRARARRARLGRRTRGFRRRRLASRGEGEAGEDYEEDRLPLRSASTNVVPWVVGGVAGLVALVGAIIVLPEIFGDPLVGTWAFDGRRTPGLIRSFLPADGGDSAFAREAYENFARRAQLTIGDRTVTLRYDLPTLPNLTNAPYTLRRYAGGKYDLIVQLQYQAPQTLELELKMGILYLRDSEGRMVAFRKE